MFGFLKKQEKHSVKGEPGHIYATQTGQIIPLSKVPDDIISSKALGDGVAIIPSEGKVVSPVDGTIMLVTDTLHAYAIQTADGLELLIHIGIDTVTLKGKGFRTYVKQGQKVCMGDPLCDVDLSLLKEHEILSHTMILISNMNVINTLQTATGKAQAGITTIMNYQ